jgi:hypothetical protein
MEYEAKKVLEVIEEIDKALLYLSQHVLTNARNFLAKEGGA